MSEEEEGEGEVCEVCKDSTFVATFCKVIGGDKECIELTERAGRGEITQEQYYAQVIEKYGREKVAMAMEKALVKDRIESNIKTPVTPAPAATKAKVVQQPEAQVPTAPAPGPQVQPPGEDVANVEIPEEERKLATGIADDKEKHEMEERAKAGMPKFKTSLKGMCLPCIGEPASAVLSVVKMWYTGSEKEKIEDLVKQMRDGAIMVEDAIKEVLKLKGGEDCYNTVLEEFNKVTTLAVDSAIVEKSELAKEKK